MCFTDMLHRKSGDGDLHHISEENCVADSRESSSGRFSGELGGELHYLVAGTVRESIEPDGSPENFVSLSLRLRSADDNRIARRARREVEHVDFKSDDSNRNSGSLRVDCGRRHCGS